MTDVIAHPTSAAFAGLCLRLGNAADIDSSITMPFRSQAALFATIVAALRPIPNRGWTGLFAASYWAMLVFYHLGVQSICPSCIQAYANYCQLSRRAGGRTRVAWFDAVANRERAGGSRICGGDGCGVDRDWPRYKPGVSRASTAALDPQSGGLLAGRSSMRPAQVMRTLLPAGSAVEHCRLRFANPAGVAAGGHPGPSGLLSLWRHPIAS